MVIVTSGHDSSGIACRFARRGGYQHHITCLSTSTRDDLQVGGSDRFSASASLLGTPSRSIHGARLQMPPLFGGKNHVVAKFEGSDGMTTIGKEDR
jgi:hypothetical protein